MKYTNLLVVCLMSSANISGIFRTTYKRREQLVKVKRIHQFIRDVEDEKLWIDEKMPQATSTQYGNSLLSVQMLVTKNQVRLCWSFVVVDN
jgi:hypothetical protein